MNSQHMRDVATGIAAGLLLMPIAAMAGRFGGWGAPGGAVAGGVRGGGFQAGGFGVSPIAPPSSRPQASPVGRPAIGGGGAVHGPYGGLNAATRPTQGGAVERHVQQGPRGGNSAGGGGGRSYTGPGGTTIQGGGGGGIYTGPNGAVAVGAGRGGSITGPGGHSVSGGRGGGVVIGPNGNVHAGGARGGSVVTPGGSAAFGSRGSVTTGPGGITASGSRGGIAAGPGGVVAGGSRVGIAAGPGGVVAGGSRVGVAAGPGGAVAGGSRRGIAAGPGGVVAGTGRGAAAIGPYGAAAATSRAAWGLGPAGNPVGTRYVSATSLVSQGAVVRGGFRHYHAFNPGWYARYPGAWFAAGWGASTAWKTLTWGGYSSYLGFAANAQPVYYDYGNTVTYQGDQVYYDNQPVATAADYAQQAALIADAGRRQATPVADDSWQPLGVFAMARGEETTSNDIFQLAINKAGTVRGNYYNAISDSTQPVSGSVDVTTQRLAWTIGSKVEPVYETGLYNLTQEQTTLLVHFGKDRTEQFKLFRIESSDEDQAEPSR